MKYKLFDQISDFANTSFPEATETDHLRKLSKEVEEAINTPKDINEYADCFIALLAAVSKAGFSRYKFKSAVSGKIAINNARTWNKIADDTYQHIKQS